MNLIDFIIGSNNSKNSDDLLKVYLKFLNGYGIDRFMMAELSYDSTSEKERNLGPVNYPEEWLTHYFNNHYVDHDPVYQKAFTAAAPFTWDEVQKGNISKQALKVMNEAKECKLHGGIGISIHQPFGRTFGIGLAGSEKGGRCDKDALCQMHAASHQFLMMFSDLSNNGSQDKADVMLSLREREVLHWIAVGKTKSAIADILFLSESTVKRHCEKVFIKLQVNNLSFAVNKAIRMGFIQPF